MAFITRWLGLLNAQVDGLLKDEDKTLTNEKMLPLITFYRQKEAAEKKSVGGGLPVPKERPTKKDPDAQWKKALRDVWNALWISVKALRDRMEIDDLSGEDDDAVDDDAVVPPTTPLPPAGKKRDRSASKPHAGPSGVGPSGVGSPGSQYKLGRVDGKAAGKKPRKE